MPWDIKKKRSAVCESVAEIVEIVSAGHRSALSLQEEADSDTENELEDLFWCMSGCFVSMFTGHAPEKAWQKCYFKCMNHVHCTVAAWCSIIPLLWPQNNDTNKRIYIYCAFQWLQKSLKIALYFLKTDRDNASDVCLRIAAPSRQPCFFQACFQGSRGHFCWKRVENNIVWVSSVEMSPHYFNLFFHTFKRSSKFARRCRGVATDARNGKRQKWKWLAQSVPVSASHLCMFVLYRWPNLDLIATLNWLRFWTITNKSCCVPFLYCIVLCCFLFWYCVFYCVDVFSEMLYVLICSVQCCFIDYLLLSMIYLLNRLLSMPCTVLLYIAHAHCPMSIR